MSIVFISLIEEDEFLGNLWQIYEDVRRVKDDNTLGLAIVRNDYMFEPADPGHVAVSN